VVLEGKDTDQYTAEDDKIATDYALNWILMHWRDMPQLLSRHFINMWTPYTTEVNLPFKQSPNLLSSQVVWYMILYIPIPIFLLAFFGLLVTWHRRKRQLLIAYAVIALTIAQNLAFWGNMRFRAPIEPLLVLLASGALWWLVCDEPGTFRYRRKQKRVKKIYG